MPGNIPHVERDDGVWFPAPFYTVAPEEGVDATLLGSGKTMQLSQRQELVMLDDTLHDKGLCLWRNPDDDERAGKGQQLVHVPLRCLQLAEKVKVSLFRRSSNISISFPRHQVDADVWAAMKKAMGYR